MMTILETMNEPPLQAPKFIPIDKIEHDRNWNSRKYIGDDGEGGSPEQHSFEELVISIREDGQDTPVEVKQGSDGHYFLISGFRRFCAFRRIYADGGKVQGVPLGHIKAYVHESLSELDALVRNGRENTGRTGLNMADTAYLIHRLAEHGLNETQIATRLALSQPYVNSLHVVYKKGSELRIKVREQEMTVLERIAG
jgi:ParB/RepB/Spo0J family partition protein